MLSYRPLQNGALQPPESQQQRVAPVYRGAGGYLRPRDRLDLPHPRSSRARAATSRACWSHGFLMRLPMLCCRTVIQQAYCGKCAATQAATGGRYLVPAGHLGLPTGAHSRQEPGVAISAQELDVAVVWFHGAVRMDGGPSMSIPSWLDALTPEGQRAPAGSPSQTSAWMVADGGQLVEGQAGDHRDGSAVGTISRRRHPILAGLPTARCHAQFTLKRGRADWSRDRLNII